MAQSIARSAVSQAAHDRLETGRSIADRTDLQKHERLYALAMLRTVFPEMELKPGERSLLLVVGKNAQMRGGSISKPVKYFFRRISA